MGECPLYLSNGGIRVDKTSFKFPGDGERFVRRTYVYCPSWPFPWIKEMHDCSCNNYRISWYAGRVCGLSLFEKLGQSYRSKVRPFGINSEVEWPLRLPGLPQVPNVSLRSALRKPGNQPFFAFHG